MIMKIVGTPVMRACLLDFDSFVNMTSGGMSKVGWTTWGGIKSMPLMFEKKAGVLHWEGFNPLTLLPK